MDRVPLVSIVVPVFNSEAWIDDCLKSLLGQAFDNWELILVDDCSTDGSLARCRAYEGDGRVRVLPRKVGGGAGAARNTGLAEARGEYVYFFDSDDMLAEDALQTMVDAAEAHDLGVLFFGAEVLCENDALSGRVAGYESYYARPVDDLLVVSGEDMLAFMVEQGRFVATPGLQFYRRKCLMNGSVLYPEGIIFEDNLFTIESCLAASRAGMMPDKLFIRRLRAGSVMTSEPLPVRNFKGNFTLAVAIFDLADAYGGNRRIFDALTERAANFANLAYGDYLNILRQGTATDFSWMDARQKTFFQTFFETRRWELGRLIEVESQLVELQRKNDVLQRENQAFLDSVSYRVGRAVTAAPRAIKGLLGALACKQRNR